ncbi:MAG: phage/plasmid primase, P4 family [Acetobacteraceae bacterium]
MKFTERYRGELRHVAAWGHWFIWDGTVWKADETTRAFDLARIICRQAATDCRKPRIATAIASAKTVAAVEKLAKADRAHAATADQWDCDPWLLNTPGGVVDLRTAAVRPARPDHHMTKITSVAPGGDCSRWHSFLSRITGNDGALHDFLQRAAGYALTGITREHALFFGYGTGANGKGTFLNTMTAIMGDYATVATMETFIASPSERHPADLAMLRGARLVAAQETEEGRRWAETRIKAMTGGDPITARFMRQDFFTFTITSRGYAALTRRCALQRHDSDRRTRPQACREAPPRMAGNPPMGDRGLPALAADRPEAARRGHRRNRRLPGKRRRVWTLDS